MSYFLNNILFVQDVKYFTLLKVFRNENNQINEAELVFYLLTYFPVPDKTGVVLKDVRMNLWLTQAYFTAKSNCVTWAFLLK